MILRHLNVSDFTRTSGFFIPYMTRIYDSDVSNALKIKTHSEFSSINIKRLKCLDVKNVSGTSNFSIKAPNLNSSINIKRLKRLI